uniref:Uncharacterized protein n=1 Tax=Anguilla anguilla TaxID=7936 RepID=A0A0E9SAF8_ANGAN
MICIGSQAYIVRLFEKKLLLFQMKQKFIQHCDSSVRLFFISEKQFKNI